MDLLLPSGDVLSQLLQPDQMVTDRGGHHGVSDVTPAQLDEALGSLASAWVEYVILLDGEAFLQAAGDGDGPYELEYSPGNLGEQEAATDPIDRGALAAAMHAFLAGDPSWRTAHSWTNAGLGSGRGTGPVSEGGGFLKRLFGRG